MGEADDSNLKEEFEKKISLGQDLLSNTNNFNATVRGVNKLQKKIKQEISFLKKVFNDQLMKKEHLLCTNLHHYCALITSALHEKDCVSLLEIFSLTLTGHRVKRICVDIVSHDGQQWVKVVARNPVSLSRISVDVFQGAVPLLKSQNAVEGEQNLETHLIYKSGGEYGEKSVLDQAEEYTECAKQHLYHYQPPKVVFHFASGIANWLANSLENVGVTVTGERRQDIGEKLDFISGSDNDDNGDDVDSDDKSTESSELLHTQFREVSKLNLDITTLIAYVSSLTNGGCHYQFKEQILNQQAEWERLRPVKPILDRIFEGKELYCCETALRSFEDIMDTLGGVTEKERAKQLMSRVRVVPDVPFIGLRVGGKLKQRSVTIFGTGHAMQALTVTANEGFVRAAKNQGMSFTVFVHESRALTESKQQADALQG